jgi:aminoglycoside phosphotransferase family enzyme
MSSIPVDWGASVAERLRAEVSETHTAVVIFIGDRAYKIKKPVDLDFLNFSRPAARRAACEREISPIRRFSPDMYEGLAEIRFPWGGPPEPVVVLRRMTAACRPARLVNTGAPVREGSRVSASASCRACSAARRGQGPRTAR